MKTLAIALALCSFASISRASEDNTLARVKQEVTRRYEGTQPGREYVRMSVPGFKGHAFKLAPDASYSDDNQPGVLMFDPSMHLIAVGFSRPNVEGVNVLMLGNLDIVHVGAESAVATR